jgi:two-component system sensor histidine kinase BaeS
MFKGLRIKFLLLLLTVSIIALSAALLLREMMIRDFGEFREGELEDRIYWITADLESAYEHNSGWEKSAFHEDTIRALMLGLEIRIIDQNGDVLMDTAKALDQLSPLMKKRVTAISGINQPSSSEQFTPHPLFLEGKEIGTLEVRFLPPRKEDIFIRRSNRFLLLSLLWLGGLAVLASLFISERLTAPIKKLAAAAESISRGDYSRRIEIRGDDEISSLSKTFNKMSQSLETQESLRKKMISNIGHELRTPVSAMKGELEGMMDGVIPLSSGHLQSLHEETGRLQKIIEGIEELTQAQASVLSLRKQSIDLLPFLQGILGRFRIMLSDKSLTAELHADKGLTALADPDRLSQIVINLLDNAIRATGKGGKIWIRCGRKDKEIFLEAGDSGHGIKPEDIPFVFERFYKTCEGGLGLGLAIVRELADAHGGRIEVKSEYGKGAVFTLFLPAS